MKVGSVVLGVTFLSGVMLMQGCVTSESQGSGRGAGARHRGIGGHVHRLAKQSSDSSYMSNMNNTPSMIEETTVIIDEPISTSVLKPVYKSPTRGPSSASSVYTVQKGDTLSGIAMKHGTTTKTLISMNNLADPNRLYIGQKINVPAGSKKINRQPSSRSKARSIKPGGTYTIQKGDSLSKIASRADVSISDLKAVNNLTSDRIYAGKKLIIPSHGKDPSATKKAAPTVAKKTDSAVEKSLEPDIDSAAPAESTDTTSVSQDFVREYLVHKGDTLESIARNNGVSKSEIIRLNGLTGPEDLRENMRLRIPVQ